MCLTTAFASFMAASAVLASPVSHAPAAVGAPIIFDRSLCQAGIPCVIQQEVNNALTPLTNAITILQGPLNIVINDVETTAVALVKVAAELNADLVNLAIDIRNELKAQIVAAISVLIGDIETNLTIITNGVVTVNADLDAAVNDVVNAIVTLEAVVGPFTP